MLECLAADERLLRVCFTISHKLQILSIFLGCPNIGSSKFGSFKFRGVKRAALILECLAADERLLRVCFTIIYKLQIFSILLTLSKRWPSVTGLLVSTELGAKHSLT